MPGIFLKSKIPLRQFQDAMEGQWAFRPLARRELVLDRDQRDLPERRRVVLPSCFKRTLDDSLAHEFVHYIQVHYLRADLADPSLESDAVAVQHAFQRDHLYPPRAEAAR